MSIHLDPPPTIRTTAGGGTSTPADHQDLTALLHPRNVAMVGSAASPSLSRAYANRQRFAAAEQTVLVGSGSNLHSARRSAPTLAAVPGGVDCAVIALPPQDVPASIREAAQAGARSIVLMPSGSESPHDGELSRCVRTLSVELGVPILGPGSAGFANVASGATACSLPDVSPLPGPVAMVSQNTAVAGACLTYAAMHGIRFSHVVTTGEEGGVTAVQLVEHLLDDDSAKAIALYLEGDQDPRALLPVAHRAYLAGKALVLLRSGTGQADEELRAAGVIHVSHLEELLTTAHLVAHTGRLMETDVAVVSHRGTCRMAGLPEGPNPRPRALTWTAPDSHEIEQTIAALAREPEVGFILAVGDVEMAHPLGRALTYNGIRGALTGMLEESLTEDNTDELRDCGVDLYLPSARDAIQAAAHLSHWSRRLQELDLH